VATESVKILIEAEDKASAALRKASTEAEKAAAKVEVTRARANKALAAERVELEHGAEAAHAFRLQLDGMSESEARLIAKEKELLAQQKKRNAEQEKLSDISGANKTKTSAEFFGTLAGMAGGSEIAGLAGQVAGLTEKTNQFSEVAKAGGAGAMAFKAGLVGAAAVLGVQVGQAIGNVLFETQRWNDELEKAVAKSKELEAIRLTGLQEAFQGFKVDEIELNPEGADAAIQDRIALINEEIKTIQDRKRATESSVASMTKDTTLDIGNMDNQLKQMSEIGSYLKSFTGDHKATLAEKQRNVEEDTAQLKILQDQQKELEAIIGVERERAAKREEIANQQASDNYIQGLRDQLADLNAELGGTKNQLDALVNTNDGESSSVALGLLEDLDKVKTALQEQQKEKAKAEQEAQKEEERIKRMSDLRKSEIDRLKEQAIALAEGKEAAHAFRLEQQGMASDQAKLIAAEQAETDRLNEMKGQKSGKATNLQASESRLLTRGPEQDPVAKNTAELARLAKQQLERLNKIAAKTESPPAKTQKLEVVSR
jgi:tRNA(Ser,Leu) C12 N-acetylase TAN1